MAIPKLAKVFTFSFLFYTFSSLAQHPCRFYPADCPDTDGISNVVSQDICTSNFVSPKEFAMQNSLRNTTMSMMQSIASREGWMAEDFSEISANGGQTPDGGALLADNLRPPHEYYIAWQVIVNKDSLDAWRNWLDNFNQQYVANANRDISQMNQNSDATQAQQQSIMDSANYWGAQLSQYIQSHAQEFQQAVQNNNKAYEDKYNKQIAYYNKKVDAQVEKGKALQQKIGGNLAEDQKNSEKERYNKTLLFRSACVVQVYFDFNASVGRGQEHNLVQGTPLTIPGASIVTWFHNPEPDFNTLDWHYEKSYDVAEILLGPWQPKRDSYNGYHSEFSANPKNMDEKSVKKIASDKVQTIAIHICGRKDNVKKFISQLDLTQLNELIEK